MIITNKIKCNHCGDVIESMHYHNYKCCSCGRVAVDGGHQYLRRCFLEPGDYTDLSEVTEDDRAFEALEALKGGNKNDKTVS